MLRVFHLIMVTIWMCSWPYGWHPHLLRSFISSQLQRFNISWISLCTCLSFQVSIITLAPQNLLMSSVILLGLFFGGLNFGMPLLFTLAMNLQFATSETFGRWKLFAEIILWRICRNSLFRSNPYLSECLKLLMKKLWLLSNLFYSLIVYATYVSST